MVSQKYVDRFDIERYFPEWNRQSRYRYIEASRFCIHPFFRHSVKSTLNLFLILCREIFSYCVQNGYNRIIMTTDKKFERLYEYLSFRKMTSYRPIPNFNYEYALFEAMIPECLDLQPPELSKFFSTVYIGVSYGLKEGGYRYGAGNIG